MSYPGHLFPLSHMISWSKTDIPATRVKWQQSGCVEGEVYCLTPACLLYPERLCQRLDVILVLFICLSSTCPWVYIVVAPHQTQQLYAKDSGIPCQVHTPGTCSSLQMSKTKQKKKWDEPEIVPSVPYNSYSRQKYWEWATHWHWTLTWPGDQEQSVTMLGLSSTIKTNFFFVQHCEKVGWVCAAAGLLPFCRYTLRPAGGDPGLDHLQKYFFDSLCFLEWTWPFWNPWKTFHEKNVWFKQRKTRPKVVPSLTPFGAARAAVQLTG